MIDQVRAITVSVNYHDFLAVTLPWNKSIFKSISVVTHPDDEQTLEVCRQNEVEVFTTEVFYERGAKFNKYAAIEQSLDYFGRHGWMAIIDADTCISHRAQEFVLNPGNLYIPRRRMCPHDIPEIPEERLWRRMAMDSGSMGRMQLWSGYCQIFHADDPALQSLPWFETTWATAAVADSRFSERWPESRKRRPSYEVLHIGPQRQNWAGRVTPYRDGTRHPNTEYHRTSMETMLKQRKGKRGDDRYALEKLKGD